MSYFLSVLGLVFIVEGLPYFVFPEKMKEFLAKIDSMPTSKLRAFGISIIIVGFIILSISRGLKG